ncbi:MAG: lipid A deacylase LpxR family protein [Pseudomonadales bacterium]
MNIIKLVGIMAIQITTIATADVVFASAEPGLESRAVEVVYDASARAERPDSATFQSWSFAFDNDVLVPGSRDQDYTYGVSASLSSEMAPRSRWSLNTPLQWIDDHSGISALGDTVRTYSTEIGLYGFTPEDITRSDANSDDRPYASLLYVSNSQEHTGARSDIAWRSTFTVGVLGLDLVGDLQNEVHELIDSDEARGWRHQISDGGEPTARYSIARQRLWSSGHSNVEIKTSLQGSVGYLTELSYGVSVRFGHIATRWQSFNPELANYREHSVPAILGKGYRESYFSAGMAIKARAYNVFLQGQFRDSDVEYDSGDVKHGIVEAWVGYTHIFASGYRVSYTLRGHSSELKSGAGDRNVLWGGLTFAKSF